MTGPDTPPAMGVAMTAGNDAMNLLIDICMTGYRQGARDAVAAHHPEASRDAIDAEAAAFARFVESDPLIVEQIRGRIVSILAALGPQTPGGGL